MRDICGFVWYEQAQDELTKRIARTCVLPKHHDKTGKFDHEYEIVPDDVVQAAKDLVVGPYRVDVLAHGETRWATNALRFDTEDEAYAYARDLYGRWMAVKKMRIVLDTVPQHEEYVPGAEHEYWKDR